MHLFFIIRSMNETIKNEILLDLYTNHSYVSMSYLTNKYGYSSRSIRSFISILIDEGHDIIYKRNHGYFLNHKQMLKENHTSISIDEKKERILFIVALLLTTNDYVSLTYISEVLFISKTTASNDMKEALLILDKEDVPVEINVLGHIVCMKSDKKIRILLDIISKYQLEVTSIDRIFYLLTNDSQSYLDLFKCVTSFLSDEQLQISDEYLIRFVNCLYLLSITCFSCPVHYEKEEVEQYNPIFQSFADRLFSLIQIDATKLGILEEFFYATILRVPNTLINRDAEYITYEFELICQNRYALFLQQNEKETIQSLLCTWLLDARLGMNQRKYLAEEIKQKNIDAYEIVMELDYIFQTIGMVISDDEKAYFSLYLNDILLSNHLVSTQKVKLIMIYNCDPTIYFHICRGIKNTIDNRFYEMIEMNYYTFNDKVKQLNPENVIVIDTNRQSAKTCLKLGLNYICINPLLTVENINEIQKQIAVQRIKMKNQYDLNAVEKIESLIQFHHVSDVTEFSNLRHKVYFQSGLLLGQSNIWDNYIHIYVLDTPIYDGDKKIKVYLNYGMSKISETSNAIFVVKSLIAQIVNVDQICENKTREEFLELLVNTIRSKDK